MPGDGRADAPGDFTLTGPDRPEALDAFAPPARWSALAGDPELMRYWSIIRDEPGLVMLRHRSRSAVMQVLRSGDAVTARALLEGAAAETALRTWGFRPSAAVRDAVAHALAGVELAVVEDTLRARLGASELGATGLVGSTGMKRFSIGGEHVFELNVVAGRVAGHRWLNGGQALGALRAAQEATRWQQPVIGPTRARTLDEARLFVAAMAGDPLVERRAPGGHEVLAATPEGQRRFVFTVDEAGSGYGPGTSPCLDPATLVSFAQRVERDLPEPARALPQNRGRHARTLALAADGLREAVKFLADWEDLVSPAVIRTRAGALLRERYPDLFRRDALLEAAARLDRLAAAWREPATPPGP